jgi:signal transduction histidine kinase
MTADSLPSQTAASRGQTGVCDGEDMFSDLVSGTKRHAGVLTSSRLELEDVERAFGRQVLDERVRSSVDAARTRAERLADAAGRTSEAIALNFAADVFISLAIERPWRPRDVRAALSSLAGVLDSEPEAVAVELLTGALRAPQLLELPPLVAIDVLLSMLLSLSPAVEASLWVQDESGRTECLVSIGETTTTRRFRAVARDTLDPAGSIENDGGMIIGVPVRRWQRPWAALVVRVRSRGTVEALLDEVAAAIEPVVERNFLLERNAAREHSLVSASERRLSRLGFDLHDGALQHTAALRADFTALRVEGKRVEPLLARVAELERVLRELAHSLEPASLVRRPLERVIESEVGALRERTGIDVRANVVGDFGAMTQSQKIALVRIVQEALTNIREHSNATSVEVTVTARRSCVEARIVDDGDGFEVTRTLQAAAQRGRLGLVGSSERVRLLGGTFDVRSRLGGPTTISLTLPRWQQLPADAANALQLAY